VCGRGGGEGCVWGGGHIFSKRLAGRRKSTGGANIVVGCFGVVWVCGGVGGWGGGGGGGRLLFVERCYISVSSSRRRVKIPEGSTCAELCLVESSL